ncbi:LysR family transcriptional regulator [Glaciihabitans sp. UYNi722]|uniref:LysR family transcriptional regulator n=1 Tax=Glaciihabitans sp. UYNi722 TaxID=3156344 RepID=UPI003391A251
MDLIAACRVLAEVDERGSVTRAAAALGVAQSVASRRLLALEERLGGPLLERGARRTGLTPFGRGVAPSARRLVRLADELEMDAERTLRQPVMIAVPESCSTRDLAVVDATGRADGIPIEFIRAPPPRRAELVSSAIVSIAVAAVPAEEGRWRVPLGAAGRREYAGTLHLSALRRSRVVRPGHDVDTGSRLHITPEDDLPHVRDVISRAGFAAGLVPGQLPIDSSLTTSLATVLSTGDLLLCSESEARDVGLSWRPFIGVKIARGYELVASSDHDIRRVADTVSHELGAALGASESSATTGRIFDA